mgnify:CR=1 FL=1
MLRLPTLFLLILSVTLGACDSTPRPVRVGTNVWPGYEPLYLAREEGYLPDRDVRLVELPSATDVMNALSLGHIEAGALTLDEVLTLMADGEDLVVILIFDVSAGADVLMARAGISRLRELQDQRIAVEVTALGALMLQAALDQGGLTLDDVHVVAAPLNSHIKAWRENSIDAAVTFEPYATELEQAGAHRLFDSSAIKGQIVDVLAVQRSALEPFDHQLKVLVEAYFKARQQIINDREHAYQIMNQRLRLPPSEVSHMFDGLELPDRQHNFAMLSGEPSRLEQSARQLVDVMTRYELLNRHLFVNGISHPHFVERQA